MPIHILSAVIYFTLALVFYTIGVLGEKMTKQLYRWHLAFFYLGLIFDTLGMSYVMSLVDGLTFNFHTITGLLGLILMLIHTLWATYVILTANKKEINRFHKFSFAVWLIWLIPYFTGLFNGMMN